jgi:hypothetical protein
VARNSDRRLEVFARGTDNALWRISQRAASSQNWSAWTSLGGNITSDPTVVPNANGKLEVFARGTNNALWHIGEEVTFSRKQYEIIASLAWSAWASLGGGITSDPTVTLNSDGGLEVFARGNDNAFWHIRQEAPHSQSWSAWTSLASP